MIFYIDVVNVCNCRCKYCYRSQFSTKRNDYEKMEPELLDLILSKASREYDKNIAVGLYNWSEPFLHDKIEELVGIVKNHNINCTISSNFSLMIKEKLQATFERGLDKVIVSVSGFWQETHDKYHIGGNVELIKENLQHAAQMDVSDGIKRTEVHYIEFDYNHEEKEVFEKFCNDLNISFKSKKNTFGTIHLDTGDVSTYIDRPSYYNNHDCSLLTDMVALDQRGDVYVCCGTWYYPAYRIGAYLDISLNRIQQLRAMHPRCSLCR